MTPARYASLDAWRGLAALAVLSFHTLVPIFPGDDFGSRTIQLGWAGVYLFFPISGYCVLGALDRPGGASPWAFLRRRWRRIFPPYWASIVLCVVVALLARPFNRAPLDYVSFTLPTWLSVATLTQGFFAQPDIVNPVYWTLCIEEQFYLLLAISIWLPQTWRERVFIGLTLLAVAARARRWAVPDVVLLAYWPHFAAGMATYAWRSGRRTLAAGGWIAVALAFAARPDAVGISLGCALALAALAPIDSRLAHAPALAPLMRAGVISYSLYLLHVPFGGRAVNLWRRAAAALHWSRPVEAVGALVLCTAVSVVISIWFYRWVERPAIAAARRAQTPSSDSSEDRSVSSRESP